MTAKKRYKVLDMGRYGCATKKLALVALLAFAFSMAGCFFFISPCIKIISFSSSKQTRIETSGSYVELVIQINEVDKCFYTIQRNNFNFLLRKRNFDGDVISVQSTPLFYDGYMSRHEYCLSPNGQNIAFLVRPQLNSIDLYLLNVSSGTKILLDKNISSSPIGICFISFVSDSKIIIGIDDLEAKKRARILEIDLSSKKVTEIYNTSSLFSSNAAFSPSGKFLAFFDDEVAAICIFDIEARNIVSKNKLSARPIPSNICWSQDEATIGYSIGEHVYTYDTKSGFADEVISLNARSIIYGMKFVNSSTLLCKYGESEKIGKPRPLVTINIPSKTIRKFMTTALSGDFFIINNGSKVIIEEY